MKRVSLNDIGRKTGFAASTVSKALRNSTEIPPTTREKIRRAAKALGYHPNPLLAALASKHFESKRNVGIPVAHIQAQGSPLSMLPLQEHGRRLGYRVEPFAVGDFSSGAHAARVLFARGFQGILLSPDFQFNMLPGMEWNHFSVVGWGAGLAVSPASSQPWLYRATIDHFRTVLRAWEETKARGYKRIGFVLLRGAEGLLDDQSRCGGAQFCLQTVPSRFRVPICFPIDDATEEFDSQRLADWARRYRPDAVIGFNGLVRWTLIHEKFRVPEEIGFASLHKKMSSDPHTPDETESGMKLMDVECMQAALELLDQQIRHHQYGLPRTPRTLTIYSEWIDGDSLPPISR